MTPEWQKAEPEKRSVKRTIPRRIAIYPKDIENITGRSPRTSRNILQHIRRANGKRKNQFITIFEFCEFTGIDQKLVQEFID